VKSVTFSVHLLVYTRSQTIFFFKEPIIIFLN